MNFDTTIVGQPYERTNKVLIDYHAPNTARIEVIQQQFVQLADTTHVALGAEYTKSFDILPEDMSTMIPLYSPITGELLGSDVAYAQILIGILAAIRAHQ